MESTTLMAQLVFSSVSAHFKTLHGAKNRRILGHGSCGNRHQIALVGRLYICTCTSPMMDSENDDDDDAGAMLGVGPTYLAGKYCMLKCLECH